MQQVSSGNMFKFGVKCLRCAQILSDKSNFNRHHKEVHKADGPMQFELQVPYKQGEDKTVISDFDWSDTPLPQASHLDAAAAPGLLERETGILSRAASLYSDAKWSKIAEPCVLQRDEAEALIDEMDEFAMTASVIARTQVMRSKNNALKTVPFQPLKDSSGSAYAATLARFYVFGSMFFDQTIELKSLMERSLEEECCADTPCCLEAFLFCLAQNAPNHKNADALQHAAMQMRRSLRGVALLKIKQMKGNEVESYCDSYLNPKRATPFAALTGHYYQIKRCVPHEKRLLIHRTAPDENFPAGSAVMVDTGRELKRVSWNMVRTIVTSTLEGIQSELNKIFLPGQDIDLEQIKDFEDVAVGAGILSHNAHMFDDGAQVDWLKRHGLSFSAGRHILQVLQKAGQDFLAGIGANIGGGSRRMPELCCITVEVTAQNPIRSFRIFENEGLLVGDYRKNQGQMLNPQEDLGLWVLPPPVARLLCRLIIYGKPLEVRLATKLLSPEAAIVHRTLIGACDGKPLKSTKLGALTNAVLGSHQCPGLCEMRHVREHWSTELMVELAQASDKPAGLRAHMQEVAAVSSNHSFKTSKAVYAGVFEARSVGGLRQVELREKLEFSRLFNTVVLGFQNAAIDEVAKKEDGESDFTSQSEQRRQMAEFSGNGDANFNPDIQTQLEHSCPPQVHGTQAKVVAPDLSQRYGQESYHRGGPGMLHDTAMQVSSAVSSRDAKLAARLQVNSLRPFQLKALRLLETAEPVDTKFIQAPTGVGKDLLPFAMAVLTNKVQLVFVPFVALASNVEKDGKKYGCNVVRFSDIHKKISLETAAATAQVIVLSYEHCGKAVRLAQELMSRKTLDACYLCISKLGSGWCFFNEAHVAAVDADFRDFHDLPVLSSYCPQVCCMSATMQPHLISEIAAKFGRSGFSKSISMPPIRPNLSIALKLTSDTRAYVTKDLVKQEKGERAIIFCLFKSNVLQMARHIEKAFPTRPVFQCTSGKDEDLALFNSAPSGIMVCTTVLAAGASFENVTSVYFCDCSHGPECLLQGAGRGARSENENCVATLVTTKQQLEYFIESSMGHAAKMASFCKDCVEKNLDFDYELYKLFEHTEHDQSALLQQGFSAAARHMAPGKRNHGGDEAFQSQHATATKKQAYAAFDRQRVPKFDLQAQRPKVVRHFEFPSTLREASSQQFQSPTTFGFASAASQTRPQNQSILKSVMVSRLDLKSPDMKGRCEGCGGTCFTTASCEFLRVLNDTACHNFHCQACLLPLRHQEGINMHPSNPGWQSCNSRYTNIVRKYLIVASLGETLNFPLPVGFPSTGPVAAMNWAFSSEAGNPPNIIFFIAALLGLLK